MGEKSGDDNVKNAYDQSAGDWDSAFAAEALNAHHVRACWRAFESAFGRSDKGQTIVELGVGTGLFTDRLAGRFNRLIAVDYSSQMIDALRAKMTAKGIANVEYLTAKAEDLHAIPDDSADAAVCFGLLENIPDLMPLFREVGRILKPGGRFVGVASNAACPWYKLRRKLSGDKWYWQNIHLCTARELREAAEAVGLTVAAVRGWGLIPSQFPNTPLLAPLAVVEHAIELTPLRRWMGGLAFRFDKPDRGASNVSRRSMLGGQ